MQADRTIRDSVHLREVYNHPAQAALDKVIDRIDEGAAAFIAASPFFVLSTASDRGADASPRGGPPGFVRTLGPQRLAWGDLVGNNRLDSFGNLLEQPNVGMVFLVPGIIETGMKQDWSWATSARAYVDLYRQTVNQVRGSVVAGSA